MDGPSAAQALSQLMTARGLSVEALRFATDGTISAERRRSDSSRPRLRSLPPAPPVGAPDAQEIVLGEELGRGGMGVVSEASQRSLRRTVAVKRAISNDDDGADLVEEAWVLARLAHPSIVPVHALAYLDGAPAVVMKRIAGTPWSAVLARPEHPLVRGEPLAWHLRTLIEVTRAIEHAHEEGIVHLDLKPQNVMIGEFGEVYVLDWGLAARIGAEPSWLAPTSSIESVAGTPEYMAPELALAMGASICAQTDVYLLGAILHELVLGRVIHDGDAPIQRLFRACMSAPPDLSGAPDELAAVIRRATAKEPSERFESARAFREAVEDCVRHLEAHQLFQRAEEEAAALDRALAEVPVDREKVHTHFGGARFAAREARALCLASPARSVRLASPARSVRGDVLGLDALEHRLFGAMCTFALEVGEVALASSYLAEIPGGDPALSARIDEARSSMALRAAHVRRLERLAKEEDLGAGRVLRSVVTFVLGLAFLAINLAMGWAERTGLHTWGYLDMVLSVCALFSVVGPWAWWRRAQLFPNRAGGSIWAVVLVGVVVTQGLWGLAAALDVPFHTGMAVAPIVYTLSFGALATLLDARLWPAAIVQVPTALLAAAYGAWVFEIVGVGAAISVLWLAIVWTERAIRTRTRRPA